MGFKKLLSAIAVAAILPASPSFAASDDVRLIFHSNLEGQLTDCG